MKNSNHELEALFSDSRLAPDAKFAKQLQKSLTKKPRSSLRRLFAPLAAVGLVVALLLGVSLFQPEGPKQLASKSVLVRTLYAEALADELPAKPKTTFWNITKSFNYGAAAGSCGFSDMALSDSQATTSLFYNNGTTTAYYVYGGYANDFPVLGYSEDPDVKAFDLDELNTNESSEIRGLLLQAELTDKAGNKLPAEATTPYKESGIYDIYTKTVTTSKDAKNYVEGCETILNHIQIDAAKGSYNVIETYRDSVEANNLIFRINQIIDTKEAASFEDVLPVFEAAGYDLEAAKSRTAEFDYLAETNNAIGIQFYYRKSALGKPKMTTVKNQAGEVTEYKYSFSREPSVIYHFRTPSGLETAEFKNAGELKTKALQNGWTIVDDDQQNEIILSGYGQVKSHYLKVHDGKNYYVITDSGSPALPSVYVTVPYGYGDRTVVDKYIGDTYVANDLLSPASSTLFYKPGTSPPKGL